MTKYSSKLLDPRWQKKRLEVMSEAHFGCSNCGDLTKTLHVHHKFYLKGKEPWEYENDQLECLCVDCHDEIGLHQQLILHLLSHLDSSQLDEIAGYIMAILDTPSVMKSYLSGKDWRSMPGWEYFVGRFNGSRPRVSDNDLIKFAKDIEAADAKD